MEFEKSLIVLLKAFCEYKNIKPVDLFDKTGIDMSVWQNILIDNTINNFSIKQLKELLKVLNVDLGDFVCFVKQFENLNNPSNE
jgi:DNA-binding Xre family transcriptional regulator